VLYSVLSSFTVSDGDDNITITTFDFNLIGRLYS